MRHSRCLANAEKIKKLPPTSASKMPRIKFDAPTAEEIVKIIKLPTSLETPQYPSVEGIVQVTRFNQTFMYLACSICNRATDAFGDGDFWCKCATIATKKCQPSQRSNLKSND